MLAIEIAWIYSVLRTSNGPPSVRVASDSTDEVMGGQRVAALLQVADHGHFLEGEVSQNKSPLYSQTGSVYSLRSKSAKNGIQVQGLCCVDLREQVVGLDRQSELFLQHVEQGEVDLGVAGSLETNRPAFAPACCNPDR